MAKYLSDTALDTLLDYISTATEITVCSAEPTDYTKAHTTYMICTQTIDSADFTKDDGDASGRKVTVGAQTGISVTNPGTSAYIALTIPASSTLIAYTTCSSQVISAGNTVNIPAFDIEVGDPT